MRYLLAYLLSLVTTVGSAQSVVHHRAELRLESPTQRIALTRAGLALDHVHSKGGLRLIGDFTTEELQRADALGVDYRVLISDVGQFYRDRNDPAHAKFKAPAAKTAGCAPNEAGFATPANYHGGSMGGYLTYAELLAELDEMYAYSEANGLGIITPRADNTNPDDPDDLVTAEGRLQQWLKISDDPATEDATEPGVLYTALHHAREPHSMQQLVFFMWYLLENYATDPEVRGIVDNTELYFLPCLNPDGYVYNENIAPGGGGLWRKNRRPNEFGSFGVDLNRNYDYITPGGNSVFGGDGASAQSASDVFHGTHPFSEPETRGVRHFVETREVSVALNNHTSGQLLLYPFGYRYNTYTTDDAYFQLISSAMVRCNQYDDIISSELYPAAGVSDDFMYGYLAKRDGGTRERILAFTPEIGYSFWPAVADQEVISRDMLVTNLMAAALPGTFTVFEDISGPAISTLNYRFDFELTSVGMRNDPVTVRLEPVSDNLAAVSPAGNFPELTTGIAAAGSLDLTLTESVDIGNEVVFDVVINNGKYERRRRIRKVYGNYETVLSEQGDGSILLAGPWGSSTTISHPDSPGSSITDSPGTFYRSNVNAVAEFRDPVDLTDASLVDARVEFWARWDIEKNYDEVQFQVSADGGNNWTSLCGRYTRSGTERHRSTGEPLYDGRQQEWVREYISLSDYLGQEVRLRFVLRSDGGQERDGFYFDDFRVKTLTNPAASAADPITEDMTVLPNPASDRFLLQTPLASYDYQLTDLNGQVVRMVSEQAGNTEVSVAGLPAGVYLLRVIDRSRERTLRVVVE